MGKELENRGDIFYNCTQCIVNKNWRIVMKKKQYKWFGLFLAIVLLISNVDFTAQAVNIQQPEEITEEAKHEQELQAAYNKPVESNAREGWPQGPGIYGEAAIVMDMDTGAVLYEKAADEKHYPASITKVLTALIAIENSSMNDTVTFSEESVNCLQPGYAHIAMKPGETITMKDALSALLLASANEAGYAIGETVAGNHEKFIEMMNKRAKELGCTNSNFVNTNGMFDENHYTTPRDMALIAKEAFRHSQFREIEQETQHTIPATNLEPEPRTFQQKHKMMRQGYKFYDERCVGGKTGYTTEASNTLITYMESNGRHLVCVDMCSRKNIFPDTKAMCDYGFSQFENVKISDFDKEHKLSQEYRERSVTLPAGVTADQIESKEEKGYVNYYYQGTLIGKAKLQEKVVKKDTEKEKEKAKAVKKEEKEKKQKKEKSDNIIGIAIVILVIVLIIAGGFFVSTLGTEQSKKRRYYRKRRIQRMFKR